MRVEYSRKYLKKAKRLPKKLVDLADEKEYLFRVEPHHPSLRTHQLGGKDRGAWAFWINQKYRIKFVFLDVGTHDIYS